MSLRNKHPETAGTNRVKDSDILPIFDYKDATKTQTFRLFGPILSYEDAWIDIVTQQDTNIRIPVRSIDLDPYTDTHTSDVCPIRKSGERLSRIYYINAVWREKLDARPAKLPRPSAFESKLRTVIKDSPDFPEGFKAYQMENMDSKTWTPWVVLRLTPNMLTELVEMGNENILKFKSKKTGKIITKTAEASDLRYGFDVKIKYNPKGTGTGKYKLTMGDVTPLEEELEFPLWKLDLIKLPSLSETEANWRSLQDKMVSKGGSKKTARKGEDLDEDEDTGRNNKKRRASREDDDEDVKPKRRSRLEEDEDEDSEEPPKKKRRRSDDEDDDDVPF